MSIAFLQYGGDQKFHLEPGRLCHIGRSLANEVVVQDAEVSRHHASVEVRGNEFFLSDAGSRNGTYLNGSKISGPVKLKNGDRIEVGNTQVLFQFPNGSASAIHEDATIAASMYPPTQLSFALVMSGLDRLSMNSDNRHLNEAIDECRKQVAGILARHRVSEISYSGDVVSCRISDEGGLGAEDVLDRALQAASDMAITFEQLPARAGVIGRVQVSGGLWLQEFADATGKETVLKNSLTLAAEAAKSGASMQLNAAAVQRLRRNRADSDKFLMEPAGGSAQMFPGSASLPFFQLQNLFTL